MNASLSLCGSEERSNNGDKISVSDEPLKASQAEPPEKRTADAVLKTAMNSPNSEDRLKGTVQTEDHHESFNSLLAIQPPGSHTTSSAHLRNSETKSFVSEASLKDWRFTFEPVLREFSSFMPSFDRLRHSQGATDDKVPSPTKELKLLDGPCEQHENKTTELSTSHSSVNVANSASRRLSQKHHQRQPTVLRISTDSVMADRDGLENKHPPSNAKIVAPAPVSPVRLLKVKNSIPQLMKALPPLPAEAAQHSSESSTSTQLPILQLSKPINLDSGGEQKNVKPLERLSDGGASIPPKFRLRIAHSSTCSLDQVDEQTPLRPTESQPDLASPSKPKLKVRVSRSPGKQWQPNPESTILRSPALKQCNSLADLEHCSRLDLFTNQCRLGERFMPTGVSDDCEIDHQYSAANGPRESDTSPPLSDQFDLEYNALVKAEANSPQCQQGRQSEAMSAPGTRSDSCSLRPRVLVGNPRGLRQKLSMLRLKLGAHRGARVNRPAALPVDFEALIESTNQPEADHEPRPSDCVVSARSEKKSGRVKRWATGAKRAVRSYVKRSWDRSSRSSA